MIKRSIQLQTDFIYVRIFYKYSIISVEQKKLFTKENKESLDKGLEKTKESFFGKITKAIAGKSTVDADVLDNLEEILISGDVGVNTTIKIIKRIEDRVKQDKYVTTAELNTILRQEVAGLLSENNRQTPAHFSEPLTKKPHVIMVVGVNGVGKTTTIGKLAHQYKQAGKSVMLGAADTFRAAAVDQLVIWSERAGVPIVHQGMGADPASVAFDTLNSAKAKDVDVVIIDTAGRLHNKINLMNELTKSIFDRSGLGHSERRLQEALDIALQAYRVPDCHAGKRPLNVMSPDDVMRVVDEHVEDAPVRLQREP